MNPIGKSPRISPPASARPIVKIARPEPRMAHAPRRSTHAVASRPPIQVDIPPSAPSASPVSHFIDLEVEARQCATLDALRLSLVNSTRKIAQFDQAFLVEPGPVGVWRVAMASSVSKIDRNAGAVRAIDTWLAHPRHAELLQRGEPRVVNLQTEVADWGLKDLEFAFPNALWLPIKSRSGQPVAALVALKHDNWRPQHSALLLPLADAYGHAWRALLPQANATLKNIKSSVTRSRMALAVSGAALLAAFIPVRMSAIAPAEIVAAESLLVTSPIEGVIKDVMVSPGTWVDEGTPIIRFVDTKLRNDVEIAERNKAVAEARYFKSHQSALSSQKDT